MTLIEKLEERRDQFDAFSRHEVFDKHDLVDTVQTCIDIVKKHGEWISVDDRLPEPQSNVLVFYSGKFIDTAFYSERDFELKDGAFVRLDKPIPVFALINLNLIVNCTHWQPLPQPPKEVQDD